MACRALGACSRRGAFLDDEGEAVTRPRFDGIDPAFYNPCPMPIDKSRVMFDRRTVIRHTRSGRITEQQLDEYVANLPDRADNVREANEDGDDDGYDRPRPTRSSEPARPLLGGAPLAVGTIPVVPPLPVLPTAPPPVHHGAPLDLSAPPPPPVPPLGDKI